MQATQAENRRRVLGLSESFWWLLIAAGFSAACCWHILYGFSASPRTSEHAAGLDDAYISFRYAANLLAGEGLVFNPGERVEGYSNFLYVLASAVALSMVSADVLFFAMSAFNLLLALVGLWVYQREMRSRSDSGRALIATGLFAACPLVWLWVGSGMETVAVMVVQLGLWVCVHRLDRGLSSSGAQGAGVQSPSFQSLSFQSPRFQSILPVALLLNVLTLLRADGFLHILIVAFHFGLQRRWRLTAALVASSVPSFVGYLIWRLAYYGLPWPNTYYAKVDEPIGQRLSFAISELHHLSVVAVLAPFLLVVLWLAISTSVSALKRGFPRGEGIVPFEGTLGASLIAYWLYVGGDHFDERFLLVLYPLGLAILLGRFCEGLGFSRRSLVVVGMLYLFATVFVRDGNFRYQEPRYDSWITLGKFLGEQYPNRTMAVEAAGKIPYFSGLEAIDMLGLTDSHIAHVEAKPYRNPGHNKTDPAYVLDRRPDLIVGSLGRDLSVAADLAPEQYLSAGYRIAWLLNISRQDKGANNVIAVSPKPRRRDIQLKLQEGYAYVVLARNGV